ncbi:hypothetical protein KGY77_09465 [Candidatus Bipolaricaulota bacterium]|nr:hypothetical protein [Candidatus Bipolaricaulota bacterium]MBS3792857.1 hypothetical protein [Candidatus Bipolaricaulota bacterium]
MQKGFTKLRTSWLFIGFASLVVSLIGAFRPEIYDGVVSTEIVPGVFSQDIFAIAASLALVILALTVNKGDTKKQVAILGLLGFFFYAYGLYVIEQVYTEVHLGYMAIFGVTSFSIPFTIYSIPWNNIEVVSVPNELRLGSLTALVVTPLIFFPLWVVRLIPLIQNADRIEYTFSVMIIDLCFIMPGFAIVAYKTFKREKAGTLLAPALFILGFFILAPLGLAELIKPLVYDLPIETGPLALYSAFSIGYVILTILSLRKIKFGTG